MSASSQSIFTARQRSSDEDIALLIQKLEAMVALNPKCHHDLLITIKALLRIRKRIKSLGRQS